MVPRGHHSDIEDSDDEDDVLPPRRSARVASLPKDTDGDGDGEEEEDGGDDGDNDDDGDDDNDGDDPAEAAPAEPSAEPGTFVLLDVFVAVGGISLTSPCLFPLQLDVGGAVRRRRLGGGRVARSGAGSTSQRGARRAVGERRCAPRHADSSRRRASSVLPSAP